MPPIRLNRRRFLGYSAAGLALTGPGAQAESTAPDAPVRLGFVGLGNRGTALLRAALARDGVEVVALADREPKHLLRGQNIVRKSTGRAPETYPDAGPLLEAPTLDAVVVALPCDLHADTYVAVLESGRHLYAEKPLGLTLAECDRVREVAARHPDLAVQVGFQRRFHPRYRRGVELLHRGELGTLLGARLAWTSSNGPVLGAQGWLGLRARSGDWMLEQGVHLWDLLAWIKGAPPCSAVGLGHRELFTHAQPGRDVTDYYSAILAWPDGFHATVVHGWIDPADDAFTGNSQQVIGTLGGLDLRSGVATFRAPGRPRLVLEPRPSDDTGLALAGFLDATRRADPARSLAELDRAREATRIALLVRRAVDERRLISMDEIESTSAIGPHAPRADGPGPGSA